MCEWEKMSYQDFPFLCTDFKDWRKKQLLDSVFSLVVNKLYISKLIFYSFFLLLQVLED